MQLLKGILSVLFLFINVLVFFVVYIEYFMESARVRCLHTSCGVSEIERVRFLIQNNECVNTVQSTFHVVLCLLYTYRD